MAKYKIGDKVRVISNGKKRQIYFMEDDSSNYNNMVEEMLKFSGKIVTIKSNSSQYQIEECGYNWTDGMFAGLASETKSITSTIKLEESMKKFEIKDYKIDKKTLTIVVFFADGDVQKAKCMPGDTYDEKKGFETCVMKHLCGGNKEYYQFLKNIDSQIEAVDKAKAEQKALEERIARKRIKRLAKKAERKASRRAERIAEMKEAYVAALKEVGVSNVDFDKVD